MAKYIDCDYVASKLEKHYRDRRDIAFDLDNILFMLEKCPSADVVEVVRCKDCEHYVANYCTRDIKGRTNMFYMTENDFCSYGERKEGAE